MTDRRNDPSALPLPPDLAGLHAELSSILIEERPSFGPELHAELESQWGTPTPGSGFRVRHAMAAAIGALLLVSVAAPQARAGLAKLLPWNQPSELGPVVERPVTHPDVTLPEQGPVVVASDEAVEPAVPPRVPEVGEETRLERPDNTIRPHSSLRYRPPAPEALRPDPFFLNLPKLNGPHPRLQEAVGLTQ